MVVIVRLLASDARVSSPYLLLLDSCSGFLSLTPLGFPAFVLGFPAFVLLGFLSLVLLNVLFCGFSMELLSLLLLFLLFRRTFPLFLYIFRLHFRLFLRLLSHLLFLLPVILLFPIFILLFRFLFLLLFRLLLLLFLLLLFRLLFLLTSSLPQVFRDLLVQL